MLMKCLIVWRNIKLFLREVDRLMEVNLMETMEIPMQSFMIDNFHQQIKALVKVY